jgi:hypothetical protein
MRLALSWPAALVLAGCAATGVSSLPAAAPSGVAPYASVVSLPEHRASDWMVLVVVEGAQAGEADPDRSYVARLGSDLTAGTVDVPGPKWRCRFGPVVLTTGLPGLLVRDLACSADGWQSYVVAAASNDEPHRVERAHLHLSDAGKGVEVELWPCTHVDPCPTSGPVVDGRVHVPLALELRMRTLPGDPPQEAASH